MKFRSALFALALPLFSVAADAGSGPVLQQPGLPKVIVDSNSPDKRVLLRDPEYQSYSATPFGQSCRVCPTDVIQGALNDCSLMSSLAAVALASPGTIESAIQDTNQTDAQGDEIYLIRYYADGRANQYPVSSSFPAEANSTADRLAANLGRGLLSAPLTPFFAFAMPPESANPTWWQSLTGSNYASWPMLMEKGYVAMPSMPGGYANVPLYENGLDPDKTLSQITGLAGAVYTVNSPTNGTVLASVWIKDSPAVADSGSHSILGGLLRGDLNAVQPSLKVCVTVSGQPHAVCTPVCHESHTCRRLFMGGVPLSVRRKIHIRVMDVERSGPEHEIAAFDEDPTQCTDGSPCTIDVPAGPWVSAGPLVIGFETQPTAVDPLAELDARLGQMQATRAAVVVGSVLENAGCPPTDSVCLQLLPPQGPLLWGHAYYLKRYTRSAGNLEAGSIVLGDPHGSEQVITLKQFLHTFIKVYSNETKHESSRCGC